MTWDEYRVKFLASKGFDAKEIAEKIKNNEDLKLDEESKDGRFKEPMVTFLNADLKPWR